MACASCTISDGTPRGCKSNGTCGTDSCNKLTVFDWLANMQLPGGEVPCNLVEVRFKNSRKEYFRNEEQLPLKMGDLVATQAKSGHDIGMVTLTGELVRFQLRKKKIKEESEEINKIYRLATESDIDKWQAARDREAEVQKRAREMAIFFVWK